MRHTFFSVGHSGSDGRRLQWSGQRRHRPVHDHVRQIYQQFLSAVLGGLKLKQLRVVVDEVGVDLVSEKMFVLQHIQQEWRIRLTK